MNTPSRFWLAVASIAGASGVVFGAFGAHGLEEFLASRSLSDEMIAKRVAQFDTGAQYHLVHALALLAAALLQIAGAHGKPLRAALWLFATGVVLFSGSLYVLVLTNTPWLGAITPLGGVAWIAGWVVLAFSGLPDGASKQE